MVLRRLTSLGVPGVPQSALELDAFRDAWVLATNSRATWATFLYLGSVACLLMKLSKTDTVRLVLDWMNCSAADSVVVIPCALSSSILARTMFVSGLMTEERPAGFLSV